MDNKTKELLKELVDKCGIVASDVSDRILDLERENAKLTDLLNRSNIRLAELQLKNSEWTETEQYQASVIDKLEKQIENFNLCGSVVAKTTYNEVVNENAILKATISKMEITTDKNSELAELKAQIEKMRKCENSSCDELNLKNWEFGE